MGGAEADANRAFVHQDKLPKLPLPTLAGTCAKYLRTVQPLLSAEDFERTAAAVASFEANEGPKMHADLEAYAATQDNYVDKFWDAAYLEYTAPLPLNVSPVFVLEDDPTPARNDQLARASSLILSSCKFICLMRQGLLEPDMARTTPLCMHQYKSLFATARVPVFANEDGSGAYLKDRVAVTDDSRHIIVMSRGRFYYFDVIWPDGTPALTQRELSNTLARIVTDSASQPVEPAAAVGILTSEERSVWGNARRRLSELSANNKGALEVIDTALFVVCLDDVKPADADEVAANMLHGSYAVDAAGVQRGTMLNRWYDKMMLIVTDGGAGLNFEHSAVDGHTVLRFASDVFTDTVIRFAQSIAGPRVLSHMGGTTSRAAAEAAALAKHGPLSIRRPETRPRKLEFDTEPATLRAMRFAECKLSDAIQLNETRCLEFDGYGKLFIVQSAMSPDAFVQMAILAAYYSEYGHMPAVYESVLTKTFLKGRTEAARSCTADAKAYLELWHGPGSESAKPEDMIAALRVAIKAHSGVTREAAAGMGVDRHLYALSCLFKQNNPGVALPALFSDKGYAALNNNVLSTSNCGNPCLRFFGFGPVVPQGFGVGYIIKDDSINLCVTSKHRQTRRFLGSISAHLCKVQDMLLQLNGTAQPRGTIDVSRQNDDFKHGYGFFGDESGQAATAAPDTNKVGRSLSDS